MINKKRINLLSIFTLILFAIVTIAILAMPSSIALADDENYLIYNENKYYYEDSFYNDIEEHDIYTLCRTFNVTSYTDDAKINVGLYMPKGRYCTMYITGGLYKEMIDSTFSSLVDTTKYKSSNSYNFYITREQYNVSGFEFLKQTTYNDFNIAAEDDGEGRYVSGDAYHDNHDGTIYKVEEYSEEYIQSYRLNELEDTYFVDSSLILAGYFENKLDSNENIQVCVKVNFAPTMMEPVTEGDVFKAIGEYGYTSNLDSSTYIESSFSYVQFSVNKEAFDITKGGYDIEIDGFTNLPVDAKLQYIVNGNVVVDTNDSYLIITEFPDNQYTIQGLLSFETNLGEKVELKSNIITIKKYAFDVRTNNIYSTNVKVNEEYSYTLSIDRGKIKVADLLEKEIYWTFDYNQDEWESGTGLDEESPTYAYSAEGQKKLFVDFTALINPYERIRFAGIFEQEVSSSPTREVPTYDIKFNVVDGSALVVGGDNVEIKASINEVYGDENFAIKMFLAAGSYADNLSTKEDTLLISPMASGKIVVMCKATSSIVGDVEKSISLNIVNPKTDKVEIISDDSFHMVGDDLVVKLSIGGFTKFINYTPNWQVQIENGDKYENTAFTTNDGYAVVKEAVKGYYQFSVNDSVLVTDANTFRVAKVNMALVAQKSLPFLATFMVIAVIVFIILKKKVLVGKTVEKQLNKIDVLLTDRLDDKEYNKKHFKRDLSSMMLKINNAINIAEELDQKSLGQHQPLIDILYTIKKILTASSLKIDSMSMETVLTIIKKLKETYIEPAIKISSDINAVMEKFRGERTKNIMVVDPEAKDKNGEDDKENV